GTYFLMITLALGMVVWGLAFRWVSLTKGDNGIAGVPRPELPLPWNLAAPLPFFYFVLVAAALAWGALGTLARSPFGLTLQGSRESETRMRALGYDVWLHKYLAFVISGGFAGFAGVLWAWYNGFVSPVDVQLVTSVETLLMVALGGPGTLAGPALGAAVIVFLKNFVSVYTKRWLLILGAVYIGVILFAPRGVLGGLRSGRRTQPHVLSPGHPRFVPRCRPSLQTQPPVPSAGHPRFAPPPTRRYKRSHTCPVQATHGSRRAPTRRYKR